jgi:tetratricopeptide (TPR) repeat protein
LELEQTGAPLDQITEAYQKAIELDETCVGAMVNLGTIYFHGKDWKQAEGHYRRALEIDPNYALGHFNLGNLYDERGEATKAYQHYLSALRVAPDYGDAHYNLALLCQRTGQLMKAQRHWKAYLKLDSQSSWAAIARRELERLRDATVVTGSRPRPRHASE